MASCASRVLPIHSNSSILLRKEELIRAHAQWLYSLSKLPKRYSNKHLDLMQAQHLLSYFKLASCRDTTGGVVERFGDLFSQILDKISKFCKSEGDMEHRVNSDPANPRVSKRLD